MVTKFLHLIQSFLTEKVSIHIRQINPLYNGRTKRALFDGFGAIIRTITGNLGYKDAEKYDTAIESLSTAQLNLKTILDSQITILESAVKQYNGHIEKLVNN